MKKILTDLYNGIHNDYSIRRYSLGWEEITKTIYKRYKKITPTDIQFTNDLVTKAIAVTKGKLKLNLEAFARELSINIQTLHNKYK